MASDAAAIVEHTKQVLFLEDDDVAFVEDGGRIISFFLDSLCDEFSTFSVLDKMSKLNFSGFIIRCHVFIQFLHFQLYRFTVLLASSPQKTPSKQERCRI